MRTPFSRFLFLVLCFSAAGIVYSLEASEKQLLPLSSGWEFRQSGAHPTAPTGEWRTAEVPGDVHLDLLRHQLISDPYFRDNETRLQWISDLDWEYRTTFDASRELLNRNQVNLVFEGLDAYCQVFLNDHRVLTADNMFRIWRVDAKALLKSGKNELRVLFPAPAKPAASLAAADPWQPRTGVLAKTYVRKAAYEYGWDWGPIFVTSGIWRPASIEAWDEARISDLHLRQRDVTERVARIFAEVDVTATGETPAEVGVTYSDGGQAVEVKQTVELHAGENHLELPVEIAHPKLWWPAGYGGQPLYSFTASVKVGNNIADTRQTRTGLRRVELRREVDQWGRSFEIVVNGVPIFVKGADVIPFDSFPNRVTASNYRRILEAARAANMNTIRHWGGGYYETQEFYDLCDELGLMVWQDFMFGNEMQPGTYPFKLSVAQEAADQLRRLRNHPSIVVWCGNNETEAHFGWGGGPTNMESTTWLQMWKDYITISTGVLGQAVARLAPETPFWPSSPSSDYEPTTTDYQSGDQHDWSVWHGKVPFSDYAKNHFRFVSEYGFQSFPEMRTVEAFTEPEDRTGIFTPVMLAHQRNLQGNALIHEYMLRDYPEPRDFAAFLYASQVLQAEGVKFGAEHMRRDRPRCMGSLFWQLNDCWPVASWSSIDYFGRWKALQFYARRFYAPLLVSPLVENGGVAVHVVSDRTEPVAATVTLQVMTLEGKTLQKLTETVQVAPLSSQVYLQVPLAQFTASGVDATKAFVVTELRVGDETVSRNLVYLVPTKNVQLPKAHVSAEVVQEAGGCRVHLSSDVLARSVQLSFGNIEAEPADNFFDLIPGEPVDIHIAGRFAVDELKKNLTIRSLADAFEEPQATLHPNGS